MNQKSTQTFLPRTFMKDIKCIHKKVLKTFIFYNFHHNRTIFQNILKHIPLTHLVYSHITSFFYIFRIRLCSNFVPLDYKIQRKKYKLLQTNHQSQQLLITHTKKFPAIFVGDLSTKEENFLSSVGDKRVGLELLFLSAIFRSQSLITCSNILRKARYGTGENISGYRKIFDIS